MSRPVPHISHRSPAQAPAMRSMRKGPAHLSSHGLDARAVARDWIRWGIVSFAQQGPPASAKQVAYIQALMRKAGYDDFRSARTEYRLTQRQARGKFTMSEASALIDRLTSTDGDNPTVSVSEEPDTLDSAQALLIRGFPADVLADELRRRGWTVGEPG